MHDLPVLFVPVTFVFQHCWRYAQTYPSIDTPAFGSTRHILGAFGVFLDGGDVVPEKSSGLASCMRNERLRLREFQVKFFTQEDFQLLLDFFRF